MEDSPAKCLRSGDSPTSIETQPLEPPHKIDGDGHLGRPTTSRATIAKVVLIKGPLLSLRGLPELDSIALGIGDPSESANAFHLLDFVDNVGTLVA